MLLLYDMLYDKDTERMRCVMRCVAGLRDGIVSAFCCSNTVMK